MPQFILRPATRRRPWIGSPLTSASVGPTTRPVVAYLVAGDVSGLIFAQLTAMQVLKPVSPANVTPPGTGNLPNILNTCVAPSSNNGQVTTYNPTGGF